MAHPIVRFEIAGKDTKSLREFYSQLFGWRISDETLNGYADIATGDEGIDGRIRRSESGRGVLIYVDTTDTEATLNKAELLGGKRVMPPTTTPGSVTIALFTDPAGNTIGLVAR